MAEKACRLLVIDDCLDQAECLARLLEGMGHHASFIINPLDGVDAAEAFHPEAVLIDLDMPQLDGWTLAGMLRQRFPDVQLIAVTGRDPVEGHVFDAWLTKPIRLEALQELVPAGAENAV